MAQCVIDLLESVEINVKQCGDGLTGGAVKQLFIKKSPVWQAGQTVMQGVALHLRAGFFKLIVPQFGAVLGCKQTFIQLDIR